MPATRPRDVSLEDAAIGARIRLRRKQLGITQSDLARALGLTFQQVQKYERGTNRIAASRLTAIAAKLDCPVAYLLGAPGGGTPTDDNRVIVWLAEPGALELLETYAAIQDSGRRKALLAVVRALSDCGVAAH